MLNTLHTRNTKIDSYHSFKIFSIMEVIHRLLDCPLCTVPHFKDVDSLRSALITVATAQLKCPICTESVMGLDKLTIHLFSHMNSDVNRTEVSAEEVIKIDEIQSNVENFKGSNSLTIDVEPTPIICDICDFPFTNPTILELHQKLLHRIKPDAETGSYNFQCHLCTKKFKMKGSLIVHLRVAHYGFSDSNGRKKFLTPKRSDDSKQWVCDICSKMFTTKYFLKKHKRLHTGEMPYTCSQCNKSFTFQQSYHKHMLYHSSEKPYSCNECGRCFKELSTLQNHARIHSGERPFSCETCGKSFRQRVSYLVHRRIHTGVMPYSCEHCGKRFRYKVSQRSHKCVSVSPFTSTSETLHSQQEYQSALGKNDIFIPPVDVDFIIGKKEDPSNCVTPLVKDSLSDANYSMQNNSNSGNTTEESRITDDLYSMVLSPLLEDSEYFHSILQK